MIKGSHFVSTGVGGGASSVNIQNKKEGGIQLNITLNTNRQKVILFWSEVSYGEFVGDKSAMDIRVTLYWEYWLYCDYFIWVYLYCGCFNLFCSVWVCVCVGILVICVFVFTVFCIVCTLFFVLFPLCIFILICFVCASVRTVVSEWQLNCS